MAALADGSLRPAHEPAPAFSAAAGAAPARLESFLRRLALSRHACPAVCTSAAGAGARACGRSVQPPFSIVLSLGSFPVPCHAHIPASSPVCRRLLLAWLD